MNAIPLFSAEISLYEEVGSGLRVECSARLVSTLQKYLTEHGFTCSQPIIVIPGSRQISDWNEFAVTAGTFSAMRQVVFTCLESLGVKIQEEEFISKDEKHVRFNLTNLSVFDGANLAND